MTYLVHYYINKNGRMILNQPRVDIICSKRQNPRSSNSSTTRWNCAFERERDQQGTRHDSDYKPYINN